MVAPLTKCIKEKRLLSDFCGQMVRKRVKCIEKQQIDR